MVASAGLYSSSERIRDREQRKSTAGWIPENGSELSLNVGKDTGEDDGGWAGAVDTDHADLY